MHESVRWLLARGKVDRAVSILTAIAKTNGKSVSVDYLKQNIKVHCVRKWLSTFFILYSTLQEAAETLQATKSGQSTNFFKFLSFPNLRRNILLMLSSWYL